MSLSFLFTYDIEILGIEGMYIGAYFVFLTIIDILIGMRASIEGDKQRFYEALEDIS
jgi:hypothetical protein